MALFDFPYHRMRIEYPLDQALVRFGKGFTFTARPVFDIQRTFILKMKGIQWFTDAADAPDITIEPDRNAKVLDNFYLTHRLHLPFTYPAPGYGDVLVTFKSPLQMPEPESDENGVLPEFEIQLLEQPA